MKSAVDRFFSFDLAITTHLFVEVDKMGLGIGEDARGLLRSEVVKIVVLVRIIPFCLEFNILSALAQSEIHKYASSGFEHSVVVGVAGRVGRLVSARKIWGLSSEINIFTKFLFDFCHRCYHIAFSPV